MNPQLFKILQDTVKSNCGITIHERNLTTLRRSLEGLQAELGYESLERLIGSLQRDQKLLKKLIELVTTHETSFFREPRHFEYLSQWLENDFPRTRLLAWSAACSTGEEAYSIAMHLAANKHIKYWSVHGSDISSSVLDTARSGIYPQKACINFPENWENEYCDKGIGPFEGFFSFKPDIRHLMKFDCLNLTGNQYPSVKYDFIFLRNVLIYFDAELKDNVIGNIVKCLLPSGLLFLGRSESLNLEKFPLERVFESVYRKKAK